LCYADDTVFLAENMRDLQQLLNRLVTASRHFSLSLNTKTPILYYGVET